MGAGPPADDTGRAAKRCGARWFLAFAVSFLLADPAWSATLQVDRRGLTPGAYTTLAQAANAVRAGDTLEIVPGSGPYREVLDINQAGTAAAPIVIEGNGETITGFDSFQFSWNAVTARWEYLLPAPLANPNPSVPTLFRHLIAYQGQRLLMDRAGTRFTSDHATLSEDGLVLILGNASPTEGWEIGKRSSVVRVTGSGTDTAPFAWHHVYRNLRASGSTNDGFNLHGSGTDLRFENIEAFNNFDEGFSAHDAISCTIDGAVFWGNDNGLYNQSKGSIAVNANRVRAFANLGAGISMRQGANRLSNSRTWDNGVSNLALGGSIDSRSNTTYENRWAAPPFLAYQETQGQDVGEDYPYAYEPYWQGQPADALHQGYALTGEAPLILSAAALPPFALAFENWRFIYFAPVQIAVTAIAGEDADPDGDGRSNRQEYESGTHPLLVDAPEVEVWVEVPDAEAHSETGEPGLVKVHRRGAMASSLTVYLATEGSAIPGTHYVAVPDHVVIPAGAEQVDVPIVPIVVAANTSDGSWQKIRGKWVWVADVSASGGPQYAVLRVLADSAYRIGAPTGTVTLDPAPLPIVTLDVVDASASEAPGEGGLFRLRRSGAVDLPLDVELLVGGTASAGSDYAALATTVSFAPGIEFVDLPVTVFPDELTENLETVQLTVREDPAYRLGAAIGIVLIEGLPLSTVSLVASDSTATEAPGNTGAFTVSRPGGGAPLTVFFSVSGTATPGVDYQAVGGSVVIPEGVSSATILIDPIVDVLAESSESVALTLLPDPAYVVGTQKNGVVSISNFTPPTVSITVTDSSASEAPGNGGALTISRSGSKTAPLTVSYSVAGSATAGEDYLALSGTAEIPAGASALTLAVQPLPDTLTEGPETLVVSLLQGSAYVLGATASGVMTIADVAPPTVSVTVNDGAASEAAGNTGLITISRSGAKTQALTVSIALGGTATAGLDYDDPGTSITIPAGASSMALTLTPRPDLLSEGSETIVLSILEQPHYRVGSVAVGSVTVADVAPVTVSVAVVDATASESGGDPAEFVMTRSGSTAGALEVSLAWSGGATEGQDYETIAQPVTIPSGAASVTLRVSPIDDTQIEGMETVVLTVLASDRYQVGAGSTAVVTIFDHVPLKLSLSAVDAVASESPGNPGVFLISADRVLDAPVQVPLIVGGTAVNGVDYEALPTLVEIPAGQDALMLSVQPRMDTEVELTESVTLTLAASSDFQPGLSTAATVSIANVAAPVLTLATTDGSAAESPGNGGVLTVSRSGSKTAALTVNFVLAGTATPGVDYLDPGTQLVIPAGASASTVAITPLTDSLVEGTETVVLSLAADSVYLLGSVSSGTVNIADVPLPTVTLSVPDAFASESPGDSGSFRLTRSGSRTVAMSVRVSVSGSATEGEDYSLIGSQIVIPAGAGFVDVPVLPLLDLWPEGNETVVLTVVAQPHYLVASNSEAGAQVTLTDVAAGP